MISATYRIKHITEYSPFFELLISRKNGFCQNNTITHNTFEGFVIFIQDIIQKELFQLQLNRLNKILV